MFDLWSRRLLRAIPVPPGTRPLDLAVDGTTVFATLEGAAELLRFTARDEAELFTLPPEVLAPTRIAVSPDGRIAVLVGAGTDDALVVPVDRPHDAFGVPRATDLEWESADTLVVARFPGETFLRFRMTAGNIDASVLPLVARGYDGMGIVRTPDGRIGFWTASGFRSGVPARVRYRPSGSVTTYRLDSGAYQTVWGRLFLDACIPSGTSVRAACFAADDVLDEPTLVRTPPGNLITMVVRRPDLSPPMPPLTLVESSRSGPLHRRESGRELAWVHPGRDETFVTYETPVHAPAGRYLWVRLELTGTRRVSPRVRSLRAEHPAHDWLRRIPKTFSRDPVDAEFLRRYLAIFHGLIDELENRAAHREILLDPFGTPQDMLPWLASFLGLTLDDRWPVAARRTLIAEAAWLLRFRGTIQGLSRLLEIYLGEPVILLEHYRLRGMGGAILGDRGAADSRAVVGSGFRVGGAIGELAQSPLEGSAQDAFETHAHRFSVMIRGALTEEQLAVVRHILDVHRPAHTLFELCTIGSGMRVGRGLHVGISSTIGRTGGFRTLQLGGSALGRGAVLGRPGAGTVPEASRLGRDSRVG